MLIAARYRWPALFVIALSFVVTVVLGFVVAGGRRPVAVDRVLDRLAASTLENRVFDRIDVYFQQLGDVTHLLVLLAVVVLALLAARRRSGAVLVLVSTVAAIVLTKFVLKPLVQRRYDGVLSFPSTHIASVAAVGIAVAVVILAGSWWLVVRLLLAAVPLAVALTSAVAVVAERTHYSTDAIAGWCIATAVVLGSALVIDNRSNPVTQAPAQSTPSREEITE